jgi:hypothetical protein
MKSSAVIGVPSDHTALGFNLYTTVCGLRVVTVALWRSWLFITGWSLLFTMKACGHTMFMISCNTTSESAEVSTLKPARSSSSAMVAVQPVDDALVDALVGAEATVMIETDSAAAAIAAQTTRCDIHFILGTFLREVST